MFLSYSVPGRMLFDKAFSGSFSVRTKIGPFAQPDFVQNAPALPKTRSGKIMRRILRKIARGDRDLGDTSTLADESVIDLLFQHRPSDVQIWWTDLNITPPSQSASLCHLLGPQSVGPSHFFCFLATCSFVRLRYKCVCQPVDVFRF